MFVKIKSLLVIAFLISFNSCQEDANADHAVGMTPSYEMNFKFNLRWYSEDCYYLSLQKNDILHVIVNVMSGGNLLADLTVSDPAGKILYTKLQSVFTWYDDTEIQITGDYKICVRNIEHHDKKVYLNLVSFSKNQIHEKTKEFQKLNETHSYILERVSGINENIHSMRKCQIIQRIIHSADSYYIESNNEYVMYYSIFQSIVIIVSGLIQTFFIKKLFEAPQSIKPRA